MATVDLGPLYSAPLRDFISERKRVAQALKDAGRREEAKAVEKVPRPTVPAWTVNQIARRESGLVEKLIELTERLQKEQGRIARDKGAGPGFAALAAEHRQALAALREKAEEILGEQGHSASPELLRRTIANLRVGIASADTRALIVEGRLSRDLEEQDFTAMFDAFAPAGRASMHVEKPQVDHAHGRHARADALHAKHATQATQATGERARKGPSALSETRQEALEQRRLEAAARAEGRAQARARATAARRVKRLRSADSAARAALAKEEHASAAARKALEASEKRLGIVREKAEAAARDLAAAEAGLARLGSS